MSSCSCVYVDDDSGDIPSAHQASMREASCPHRCCECGRQIKPGERYEHAWGRWAGKGDIHATCADCLSVRDEFFCEGHVYGAVWELLGEHLNELEGRVPSDCLANLTPRAREMVCAEIEDIWHELDLDEEANDAGGAS